MKRSEKQRERAIKEKVQEMEKDLQHRLKMLEIKVTKFPVTEHKSTLSGRRKRMAHKSRWRQKLQKSKDVA